MSDRQSQIRNFCIIAHVDHGKSTLADRLLEVTGTIEERHMKAQLLDRMDLEREKGITIKLQPVRMQWQGYELNLIDTPGHVDFSYEVSRSLAACEGAILVVDAAQGIQAQTLANIYLALEANLTIIPVLNKLDLPAAEPERVARDIVNLLGCNEKDILKISAKSGAGVEAVLNSVVKNIPPPSGDGNQQTRALIFDSTYDEYRGVILDVRVVDGSFSKNDDITVMGSKANGEALEVGYFNPELAPTPQISTGEIGYIVTNFKSVSEARVGDTVTLHKDPAPKQLPGYVDIRPFVYASFFPVSNEDHKQLKEAIERLQLNDAALQYTPENSQVLGFGFRVGFLGLLHMEIIKERLEREYDLELIVTNPSTDYQVKLTDGTQVDISAACDLPEMAKVVEIKEPWINGEIVVPKIYVGNVVQLVSDCRGSQKNISYFDEKTALISFEAPLANVLTDFYDRLKSTTSGYGSLNYELGDYRVENLVRLDFLVGGEVIDSLSMMVHRTEASQRARLVVDRLKEVIPRQLFEVSLQAAIGGKIIAREDVKAMGKNVTGHLYGGDISRKRKLWDKQKAGKKRMKKFGKVEIPPEAFMAMLKKD